MEFNLIFGELFIALHFTGTAKHQRGPGQVVVIASLDHKLNGGSKADRGRKLGEDVDFQTAGSRNP